MVQRIDVDDRLRPVRIPARVLQELCAHALEALPEECCGLIVSDGSERYGRAVRCRNEMTSRHQRDPETYPKDGQAAFYMSPYDVNDVRRQAERIGASVTAVYHSHVGAGAYLSADDLSYARHDLFPFPDADQIVLPVFDRTVGAPAVFLRCDDDFAGHPLEPEPS